MLRALSRRPATAAKPRRRRRQSAASARGHARAAGHARRGVGTTGAAHTGRVHASGAGQPGPRLPTHVRAASTIAGVSPEVVHVVGGGSQNRALCQLTADACGLPVVAGPTEAAALGNVLVQARAHGLVGDLAGMRRLVARTQSLTR